MGEHTKANYSKKILGLFLVSWSVYQYNLSLISDLVVSYRKERERLERLLKYIVASLDLDSPKTSYIGVFLTKEHSLAWIAHVKQLAALAAQV
jgi:hypothetical protein